MTSLDILIAAFVLVVSITGADGERCPMYDNSGLFTGYQSCSTGCCGRAPNYYCCTLASAAIAGIILGCIVVLCMSVFVCAFCLKKKSHTGRVIRPVPGGNTIVFTGSSGVYPGGQPATHMPAPPPYKQYDNPPPYSAAGWHSAHPQAPQQPQPQYPGGGGPAYGQHNPPYGTPAPPPAYSSQPEGGGGGGQGQGYAYGQGHGWGSEGQGHHGQSQGQPPSSTSAPPSSSALPHSSSSSSAVPPATAASSYSSNLRSRAPTATVHNGGLHPPSTAASSSVMEGSGQGYGQGLAWSETRGNSRRNLVTTSNAMGRNGSLPSRLPPLPND